MSFEKVYKSDNAAGLSKREFDLACQRADANFATLTKKTIKLTIGGVGVAGCDFNFASAGNTTEQVIDLGAIVPALARVVDIFTHTKEAFVFSGGATTLVAETGSTSSGNQYIASASIYAADAITSIATGANFIAAPSASAGHVYVAATPGANWSTNTAGKVAVYVTVLDVSNL